MWPVLSDGRDGEQSLAYGKRRRCGVAPSSGWTSFASGIALLKSQEWGRGSRPSPFTATTDGSRSIGFNEGGPAGRDGTR